MELLRQLLRDGSLSLTLNSPAVAMALLFLLSVSLSIMQLLDMMQLKYVKSHTIRKTFP